MAEQHAMIEPFEPAQIRVNGNGREADFVRHVELRLRRALCE